MFRYGMTSTQQSMMMHIRLGGSVYDTVGMQLVSKFVMESMKQADLKEIVYTNGFHPNDLCKIFAWMVDVLSNPCINMTAGGNIMLAAALPFYEPLRLEGMLHQIKQDSYTDTDKEEVMERVACDTASTIFLSHTAGRGEAHFVVDENGSGLASADSGAETVVGGCFSCSSIGGFLIFLVVTIIIMKSC